VDVWDLLVSAGALGFILCLVPQLAKTVRSKRADDLSWGFLVLVVISSALALPYALHARQWLLAASWGVNLLVWGLVLYYKARPGLGRQP
jgi:uncharacterized protein with PQ loop repeat